MQNIKRFEEFQKNVIGWAEDKGIYEFSTPLAQALKAVSEVGELADAVIKNDIDGVKDAIGDVAVCLVNFGKMIGFDFSGVGIISGSDHYLPCYIDKFLSTAQGCAAHVSELVGYVALCSAKGQHEYIDDRYEIIINAMQSLEITAKASNLDFIDCCESAWLEIKDRKGRMVEGGAFVKDE